MSARERLRTAMLEAFGPDEDAILAADPHLAQDIADGEALRRLREADPEGDVTITPLTGGGWGEDRFFVRSKSRTGHRRYRYLDGTAPTIAEAADACREALEAGS